MFLSNFYSKSSSHSVPLLTPQPPCPRDGSRHLPPLFPFSSPPVLHFQSISKKKKNHMTKYFLGEQKIRNKENFQGEKNQFRGRKQKKNRDEEQKSMDSCSEEAMKFVREGAIPLQIHPPVRDHHFPCSLILVISHPTNRFNLPF